MIFKPHDYQKEAMAHLYKVRRSALWMPMGGGKTVSTLTALDNLSTVEDVFPVLVLAPLRVAKSTWPDEVAKWPHLSHLRVSVITGTPTTAGTSVLQASVEDSTHRTAASGNFSIVVA